jgi:Fe-S cluster assembly protein SufD
VPHCNSRQLFKGVAGGSSRVDFYGKIIVAQDAQRTEAYQENHNILLSDDARVDTKPQLEIYADDVKCSHGATIGRLNEEEQFYMRSRGITLEDAKVLQMISFLAPVLEAVPESEREDVALQLESAIRKL